MPENPQNLEAHLGKPWVDSSKIKCFQLCPKKYYWRYVLGIVPLHNESTDLAFGAAVHKGLESFYNGSAFELVEDHSKFSQNGQIRRMFKEFLDLFPEHLENKYKTRQNGLILLAQYAQNWQGESVKVVSVEETGVLDMGDFYYIVKMDLCVEDTDGIHPWDHKTASRFDALFEGSFKLDIQITGYIYGTRKLHDSKSRKAIINALRPSARIDGDSYVRKVTYRSDEELERWETDVRFTWKQIQDCEQSGTYPMHDYACFAYYRECEYRTLCLSSNVQRPELIERAYKKEVWEPL